jgi:biotin operon repressor
LVRLVALELEEEHRAVLGLMLESVIVHEGRHENRFRGVIGLCAPAREAGPLLEVDRRSGGLARFAEREASAISRKWGRWFSAIELKMDALRPAEWVARENPGLGLRALVGGDLVASILAEAEGGSGEFASEVELARRVGGSRPAVREALRKLRMAGLVRERRVGRGRALRISNDQ